MSQPNLIVNAPSIEEVEKERLQHEGYEIAQQIPIEKLNSKEAQLLTKYLNHIQLTDQETEDITKIIQKFRPHIFKHNPEQTMETIDENLNIIHDEKEFLRIVDEFDEIVTIPFSMPVGEKWVHVQFDVHPLTDSEAILDIQNNLALFQDLSEKESEVYTKSQQDAPLTREEQIIKDRLDKQIEQKIRENQDEVVTQFLAMQLSFKGKHNTYDEMLPVIQKIPVYYRLLLFNKVQEIKNMNAPSVNEVFQEFSS